MAVRWQCDAAPASCRDSDCSVCLSAVCHPNKFKKHRSHPLFLWSSNRYYHFFLAFTLSNRTGRCRYPHPPTLPTWIQTARLPTQDRARTSLDLLMQPLMQPPAQLVQIEVLLHGRLESLDRRMLVMSRLHPQTQRHRTHHQQRTRSDHRKRPRQEPNKLRKAAAAAATAAASTSRSLPKT